MRSDTPFDGRILEARKWERAIFRWLTEEKGYPAINLFEWPTDLHEGPRLYIPWNGSCKKTLLGDIWIPRVPKKKIYGAIDIKARKGFCWSDKESDWQVSIQIEQYNQYLTSRKMLEDSFWVFFFLQYAKPSQHDAKKKGCPQVCPRGLYGIEVLDIEKLGKDKTHTYMEDKFISKSSPGFYWLASYEAIAQYLEKTPEDQEDEPQIFDI